MQIHCYGLTAFSAIGRSLHCFAPSLTPVTAIYIAQQPTSDGKTIVVYMGFEDLDEIIQLVSPFADYQFQIFAKVEKRICKGHIQINPLSHQAFHNQLNRCAGVICNARFELSSEALQLGKKLLVKPLTGQYEQLCM